MQPTRDAARCLAREGKVDVMQKGNILGVNDEYRGPIRIRLCLEEASVVVVRTKRNSLG